ncbi:ABC transporter permease [Microbacterium thalassium]|uniref:Peptide/nickel transport system permease protein n=1 Tax=Microbacterium thalassium TaxID=362649 RepID=A0A7X0FPC3_9MICO|nr:ABC transporter permease [Microbacterium thalassium]MBB6390637.1 peptide/nickel transport system permease protein [Microbacterium thalassium]GLK25746.1 glutathione ABC transporter permease GsiD [Microbacterium thalassium]
MSRTAPVTSGPRTQGFNAVIKPGRGGGTSLPLIPRLKQRRKRRVRPALFWFAVVWLSVLILAAVFADVIPGLPAYDEKIGSFAQPPDLTLGGLLGTDGVGRSNLSRIIYGARVSLTIAIASTLIGLAIGLIVGMIGGYYRGVWESAANIIANTVSALPPLLLLLALVSAIGTSLLGITLALGFVISDLYIRVTKGAVIGNANREYVLAARALGAGDVRIMTREILPNLIPVLGSIIPMAMAIMIVVEGSLSFLGYGIPAPTPSWGGMIAAGADIMRQFPYVIAGPVITLFLTVLSFNAIGDYLSSRTDVREGKL